MTERAFNVAGRRFSAFNRVMIIAEIGTGHGGNIGKAKDLIDAAAESGADCAKFQIVYADEILHPDTGFVNLPGGKIRLYDRFRELEVEPDFYAEIAAYCEKKGLIFLASPFGLKSLAELEALNPPCIKIASPELNHFPLLRATAATRRPVILSSGVSRLGDIERALEATACTPERVLLHCVTSYPAPEEEYNLSVLESLSSIFDIAVGVSDHSLDPVLVPLLAVAMGAAVIEKHICLSRTDPGLDDPVALPPDAFTRMVGEVRKACAITSRTMRDEIVSAMESEYGKEKIIRILGNGKKKLAPSERDNYTRTNRSIHYMRNIKAGNTVKEGDIALFRTEKVLTPGLSPEWLDTVRGARLSRDVTSGAGAEWEDFISRSSPQ
jgi:sialic acid synthase SpsE